MVSRQGQVIFPETMKVAVIDHHRTNTKYGHINLIDASYPATAQILFDLFKEWRLELNNDIASNLFIGTYTDTGGFRFSGTSAHTFASASELTSVATEFPKLISKMENSSSPEFLAFQGMALSSISTYLNDKLAMSSVGYDSLKSKNISKNESSAGMVSSMLTKVGRWNIVVSLVEFEPNQVKLSFRTNDSAVYDVSKIAASFGGGGHKAAGGATLEMSLPDAISTVVAKVKELYNL